MLLKNIKSKRIEITISILAFLYDKYKKLYRFIKK